MITRRAGVAAVILLVMGVLVLLIEIQSPSDSVYLTGTRVEGTSVRGLVYYTVGGEQYTVVNPHQSASEATPVPVSVYVDPANPTQPEINGVTRWVDLGFIALWPVLALLVLVTSAVRGIRDRDRTCHQPMPEHARPSAAG